MSALTPIASKLTKLIRVLSSDKIGEVASAAAAITRILASEGLSIHDLASVIEDSGTKTFSEADAKEIYRQGVEDGKRAVEDGRYGSGDWRNVDGSPNWEVIVEFCRERDDRLRDNEQGLLNSVAARLVWENEPTERQRKWLLSIFYKLGGQRP